MLTLFVDDAASCERARASVEQAVQAFPVGTIGLEVRNLSRIHRIERNANDRSVVVVPTLMLAVPGGELAYLASDMEDPEAIIAWILIRAGVAPVAPARRAMA